MLALGGENDDAHVVVMGCPVEGFIQFIEQFGVLSIGPVRAVESNAGDAGFGDLIDQGFEVCVGHGLLL